jgi:hypothetical protein
MNSIGIGFGFKRKMLHPCFKFKRNNLVIVISEWYKTSPQTNGSVFEVGVKKALKGRTLKLSV